MKTNVAEKIYTHEGARAKHISPIDQLKRSIMACMLWENEFYEDGQTIAERIKTLVAQCDRKDVANLAIYARTQGKLRHAPLLLVRELARKSDKTSLVGNTLSQVINRADELAEFLSLYWLEGKKPLSAQVKKGLGRAFQKFDAYQLAKYNRDGKVKLRDVLFLTHAKPKDQKQEQTFKHLANKQLTSPDTWEVALSAGADKKETFERLIRENNLGYLALLRNLRNMEQAGCDENLVKGAILEGAKNSKALPFRFIAAARHAPKYERELDQAMIQSMNEMEKLKGKTILLVDVSGSMQSAISSKSDLNRMDAACALAALASGICENVEIYSFSCQNVLVPPRQGMALVDAIVKSQEHGGTDLGGAVNLANSKHYDRLIVFTDEQSQTKVSAPKGRGYMVNVASNRNGVGYGEWSHIDGFSEAIIDYIRETERSSTNQ